MSFTDVWHCSTADVGARMVYDEFFDRAALGLCRVNDTWAKSVSANMSLADIVRLMDTLKDIIDGEQEEWKLSTKKGTWMMIPSAAGATLSCIEPDGRFTTMGLKESDLKGLESALRERWGSRRCRTSPRAVAAGAPPSSWTFPNARSSADAAGAA